ncbi:unnamed protein product [Arctia plantaginis]|uniref:Uncharacterized protein n=1 Tax=Arctia plantaginis TaxID=874455 RepID=A0A8S1A2L0_ARCPL|nr:unnamed protein product [Arctia plantaginis]
MQVQALTGHGGIGEYLHRFHLRDNPGCECDPEVSESVWHILTECPRFQADRLDLEHRIDKKIIKRNFAAIMGDLETATLFLGFAERAFRIATERNKTDRPAGPQPPAGDYVARIGARLVARRLVPIHQILATAEMGQPGLNTRPVALFMDEGSERLGIGFGRCLRSSVTLSPGLAALIRGHTRKNTMRRGEYEDFRKQNLRQWKHLNRLRIL